jgi:hypothetical protein
MQILASCEDPDAQDHTCDNTTFSSMQHLTEVAFNIVMSCQSQQEVHFLVQNWKKIQDNIVQYGLIKITADE